MKAKYLSILAIAIGGLSAFLAILAYHSAKAAAAMPFAMGGIDDRTFWYPLSTALVLWIGAGVGILSRKRDRSRTRLAD